MPISQDDIFQQLQKVIDPELNIDIVSLGLVYEVVVKEIQDQTSGTKPFVHVLLTLTTPGCPLASVFDTMIKSALNNLEGLSSNDIFVELTFDPPWLPEMMSAEARAQLGLD